MKKFNKRINRRKNKKKKVKKHLLLQIKIKYKSISKCNKKIINLKAAWEKAQRKIIQT